jgi:hypothetical protein
MTSKMTERNLPLRPDTLNATRLKVSVVLDPAELSAIPVPEGKPRVTLHITLPNRILFADVAAKSLRKAQAAIRNAGADSVVPILQGHLIAGDVIAEAGLTAQPKTKPTPRNDPPLDINQTKALPRDSLATLRGAARARRAAEVV